MHTIEIRENLTELNQDGSPRLASGTAISPVFLVRHPGLPLEALRDLRNPRLMRIAAAMDELDAQLARLCDVLLPLLHEAVHSASSQESSRNDAGAILNVKRAVFNRRLPSGIDAIETCKPYLPDSAGTLLDEWYCVASERARLNQEAEHAGSQDIFESRKKLAQWIAHPALRKGIQIASSSLDHQLDKYAGTDLAHLAHKHRLIESSAVLYLNRAAAKTSPFSTFGTVIPGAWREGRCAEKCVEPRAAARINVAVLARIANQRVAAEHSSGNITVVLNPTYRYSGSRVHFLRQRSRWLLRVGTTAALHSQGAYSIPFTPLVDSVVRILENNGACPLRELERRLADRHHADENAVRSLLERLVNYSFLLPLQGYDKANYEAVLQYMDKGTRPSDDTPHESIRIWALQAEADRFALASDLEHRRRALRQIEHSLRTLRISEHDEIAAEEGSYLYEDVTLDGQQANLHPAEHDNLLQQLDLLQRALVLFDPGLPLRVALNEYFKRRYGIGATCRNVTELAEGFARECSEPFWNRSASTRSRRLIDLSFGLARGRRVRDLQQMLTLRDLILRRIIRLSQHGDSNIHFDLRALQEIVDMLPRGIHREVASSFFVQPLTDGPQAKWVLNKVYGGLGQMMSRFFYLWENNPEIDPVPPLKNFIRSMQPANAVYAEMRGGYDTNLNLHRSFVDWEIIFPAERTAKDTDHQIQLRDLVITHHQDSDSLELTSATLGFRVIPLYLGSLITMLLPDVHRLLLLFGPAINVSLQSWQTLMEQRSFATTTRLPRVSIGDIVLQRAMWVIPAAAKPVRERNESETAYFLKVRAWVKTHRLPNQFFAHLAPPPQGGNRGADRDLHKPIFVDTSSLLSLLAFQKQIDKVEDGFWISELLPDALSDAHTDPGKGPSMVSEYVFDVVGELS